jgi:hypothetical protein
MKFFMSVVDASGTTFEQSLLGAKGIDTIDPENIEAILSKQFNGMKAAMHLIAYSVLTGSFQISGLDCVLRHSFRSSAMAFSLKMATHGGTQGSSSALSSCRSA